MTPNWERDRGAAIRAVRAALRLIDSLGPQQTAGTEEEIAAIRSELLTWKHGAPLAARPTFAPNLAAYRIVMAWPEDDPLRQLIYEVYEAARTPLP